MPWDSDKSTAQDPDNPAPDEQLTAEEWDQHVEDGHFPSDQFNFGTDANGNPVVTDPQNDGQVVATYNRSAGTWEMESLSADRADITNGPFTWSPDDGTLLEGIQTATVGNNGEFPGIWLGELIAVPTEDESFGATDFQEINGATDDTPSGVTLSGTGMQATTPIVGSGAHTLDLSTNDASVKNLSVRQEDTTGDYDAIHAAEREWRIERVGIDNAPRNAVRIDAQWGLLDNAELDIVNGESNLYFTENGNYCICNGLLFQTPSVRPIDMEADATNNFIQAQVNNPDADVQTFRHATGSGQGNYIELDVDAPDNSTGPDIQLGRKDFAHIKVGSATHGPCVEMAGLQSAGIFQLDGQSVFSGDLLRISNDNNLAVAFLDDGDLTVSGNRNVVVCNINDGAINRTGFGNVINGVGVNGGDPSTTGFWNTNADFAWLTGATVIDENNEGDIYRPLPPSATNDWIRFSGTAVAE